MATTFVLPINSGLGGCVDICTSQANSGGSVTRPKRNPGPDALWCDIAAMRDWGVASGLLARPGEPMKLLMSDGSKQVQLGFGAGSRGRGSGGDDGGEEGRRRRRSSDGEVQYTLMAVNNSRSVSKTWKMCCWQSIYESTHRIASHRQPGKQASKPL